MERMCFMLPLKPDTSDVYDRAHEELSPKVHALLAGCGFNNYTIFRTGNTVIGYAECEPDVETVLARQAQLELTELAAVGEILAGPLVVLLTVWRLDQQPDSEPTNLSIPFDSEK